MELNILGRNMGVSDRFRAYVEPKSEKIAALAPRAISLDIRLSRSSAAANQSDRVELTLVGPGPVVRAESEGRDKFAAFDVAYGRLVERIRRAKDRKTSRRGRGRTSLSEAAGDEGFGGLDIVPAEGEVIEKVATGSLPVVGEEGREQGYSPVVIRRKVFEASCMTAEEAVDLMELVGHDFYLFVEAGTGRPSVVYRRKGWSYGVISLDEAEKAVARRAG